MLVTTNSRAHYDSKTVEDLLDDFGESPQMVEFLDKIGNRVVMVELGDQNPSPEVMKSGQAVYQAEKDQIREMVLDMARLVWENKRIVV